MNAAVEAARADDAGKGFAVVANEVKKLAECCKLAADEIITLSNQTKSVSIGSEKLIKDLIHKIANVASISDEIASSSLEQKTGAEQINNSMQNLNKQTQEIASTSERLFGNALIINELSNTLKADISFFK